MIILLFKTKYPKSKLAKSVNPKTEISKILYFLILANNCEFIKFGDPKGKT